MDRIAQHDFIMLLLSGSAAYGMLKVHVPQQQRMYTLLYSMIYLGLLVVATYFTSHAANDASRVADCMRSIMLGLLSSLSISGQIMTLWFASQSRQAAGSNPARDIFFHWGCMRGKEDSSNNHHMANKGNN
jgi:predicted membrane channel-forming protein YqfA (hemolysin III family)